MKWVEDVPPRKRKWGRWWPLFEELKARPGHWALVAEWEPGESERGKDAYALQNHLRTHYGLAAKVRSGKVYACYEGSE